MEKKPCIAYFSMEYALSDNLPTFAGGLGVLSGDYIKQAAKDNFNLISVGLYYHEGYAPQKVDSQGLVSHREKHYMSPNDLDLAKLKDENGREIIIKVPIYDREVYASVWIYKLNQNYLYLLDCGIDENIAQDRVISDRLYSVDKETRLKQEIILGIGGVRLLDRLKIKPDIFHMNEGHSSFLILELIHREMLNHKVSFQDAVLLAKKHLVFTNHTLVNAGNETYSSDLVSTVLSKYAESIEVPASEITKLGLIQDSSEFSMTIFALRSSSKINTVSKLHNIKAKEIWTDHEMENVTNGINLDSWDMVGQGRDLKDKHLDNKLNLIRYLGKRSFLVDKEDLVIVWARRIVKYKRPLALFGEVEEFIRVNNKFDKKIKVVVAGFSPPGDAAGAEMLKKLYELSSRDLKGSLFIQADYDLGLSRMLVSGSDVWLNTPVVGFEACGTSTMKAMLNGALPLTTNDGWVYEADLENIGFHVDSDNITKDLIEKIEISIMPEFKNPNSTWNNRMRLARKLILDNFTTARMLDEYDQKIYKPMLASLLIEH